MHITLSLTAQGKPFVSGRCSTQRRCYHHGKTDSDFLSGTPENQNGSWGSPCAAGSGTICCSFWQKSCQAFRAVYAFVQQKSCPDLGTRGTCQLHWAGVGLSTQFGGPQTLFQRSLQDWSLYIWQLEQRLALESRLNIVTLLNIPELHQDVHSQPGHGLDTCFIILSISCETSIISFFFAHLKIRGQCSDSVSHHMLKFIFVLSFYQKPDLISNFQRNPHEMRFRLRDQGEHFSTSATGKSNQAKNDWR